MIPYKTRENAIVESLDYLIPVTQLVGCKRESSTLFGKSIQIEEIKKDK